MNSTALVSEPLEDRPIRSLGVEEHRGWQLELYAITLPDEELAGTVLSNVRRVLQDIEHAPTDDSTGFVIVHQGREARWLLVALWKGEILHQASSGSSRTPDFVAVPAGGPTVCVWELPVLAHERDAYVAHVLEPRPPQPGGYLAAVMPRTAPAASAGTVPPEPSGVSWAEAERLIGTGGQAFSTADVPAILELFHEEFVVRYAGLPEGPRAGRRGPRLGCWRHAGAGPDRLMPVVHAAARAHDPRTVGGAQRAGVPE